MVDTSDDALVGLLNRLQTCVDPNEIGDLSFQIERIVFHKQWGRFPTCPPVLQDVPENPK